MDADVRARFEAKIDRTGTHHIWTGSRSAAGTGRMRINGRLEPAPRLAWTLAHGEPPPPDSTVRGCADDPACVHPDHLRLTHAGRPTTRAPRGHGSMTSIGPNQWKLYASAGNDDRGRRRRITQTIHGTRAAATETLTELVRTATAARYTPEAETLFRLALAMPDDERAYLATRLLDSLKRHPPTDLSSQKPKPA